MIHLTVTVANAAELLDPGAYGAGALLRWESAVSADGPWTEGGTVALVSGTSLYDIWDNAATDPTWYRTRISNAGNTAQSGYTDPTLQSPLEPIVEVVDLTPAQYRAVQPTSLTDDALVPYIQAAWHDVKNTAGPRGERTEYRRGHGHLIELGRPIAAVTEVVEGTTTLAADDYTVTVTGESLRRLSDGTHPRHGWHHQVKVTYLPVDDLAERRRVAIGLVTLDLQYRPGLTGQTQGQWSETYSAASADYQLQRDALLATLGAAFSVR